MEIPTHQLDQSISVLRVVGWLFSFDLNFKANSATLMAVSDQGLHCLPMIHKKDPRLIWVKMVTFYNIFSFEKMHIKDL